MRAAVKANKWVERTLYKRGFTHPDVRTLVRNQLYLAIGASLLLLIATALSRWALSFAAGAMLVTVNFWPMAKVTQQLVYAKSGGVFTLLTLFYIRLLLTGIALYVLIFTLGASVPGLVVGLTTVVVNAVGYGAASVRNRHLEEKVKEA